MCFNINKIQLYHFVGFRTNEDVNNTFMSNLRFVALTLN